ncbi:MAG: hypothetical protein ACPGWR_06495 [Ardenticatenaceae bacterium]
MFKINLRRLFGVLFILGLLLPTYVLPSSSTSSVAFAEEVGKDEAALDGEERGGKCQGLEICIRKIKKPDFGKEMGDQLVLKGDFPEATLVVTLRNSEGEVVHEEPVEHDGRNRLRVDLGADFEWQADSYNVNVMLEGAVVGDSFDLDVEESRGHFIRARGKVDIEKMSNPNIGELMNNQLDLTGKFPKGELEVTLHNSQGQVVYQGVIDHNGSKNLSVDVGDIEWQDGTYEIRVESLRGPKPGPKKRMRSLPNPAKRFDSFYFGVGNGDGDGDGPEGFGRCW